MAVHLLSNCSGPNTITLETITSKFQVTTTTVKGSCTSLRQIIAIAFVRFPKDIYPPTTLEHLDKLSDITNTKFPVSEGDEIILSDVMQNADVGHRVTMSFSCDTNHWSECI